MIGIWLHQFDRARINGPAELSAHWPGPVYVKALDGVSWMAEFDRSPLACDRVEGRPPLWTWSEILVPWVVPTAVDPEREGELAAALANAAGRVILDLEPYPHFWRGDESDARRYVEGFRSHSQQPVALSLDYRRLPWPEPPLHELASRYLPQCYWTTFRRPWRTVLEEAAAALEPIAEGAGKPVEYVLPGDAAQGELEAAVDWCLARGAEVSVWVWQTISPENWSLLRAIQDQPPARGETVTLGDLINLLGYLQGDVARAIREPLEELRRYAPGPRTRRLVDQALAAVSTLEREGREHV